MLTATGQKDRAARGSLHTMKITLSIMLGINAVIGLLILVLSHQ